MTRQDRMEATLREAFNPSYLAIVDESGKHAGHAGARPGGETHYRITLKAAAFAGKSRIEAHRMVNEALKGEFATGLHALSISASGAE